MSKYSFDNSIYSLEAEILSNGRKRVLVHYPECPPHETYNPHSYTTVRNIDGSNRFMSDSGGWTFLPHVLERAAHDAIAELQSA